MKAMNDPRPLKTAAALVVLGYCSLLLHQTREKHKQNPEEKTHANLLESNILVESVTKTIETVITIDDLSFTNITLDDILITVKTTKYHKDTRLPIVLKTWFQLAKNQTWFFTDEDDKRLQNLTTGHIINTHCPPRHGRRDLCCKTAAEYNFYYNTLKKWFCHFDDDNYVNVPRLVKVLQRCDYRNDWYLGKNSINTPKLAVFQRKNGSYKTSFMFATGGAGYCISRSLAIKMHRWARGTKFVWHCDLVRSPDDITMGFIIEMRLKTKLTILQEFHSHIEPLHLLPAESLKDQISLSYGPSRDNETRNVVNITGFDTEYDPTRFLSLHCFLFPDTKFCPRKIEIKENNEKTGDK